MRQLHKYLTGLAFGALILASSTANAFMFQNQTYYYGMAVGYEYCNFKKGYGADFVPNDAFGYDLFIGSEHPTQLGFEFGFGVIPGRAKDSGLGAGDKFPGTSVPLAYGTWEIWRPVYSSASMYLGLNKYYYFESVKHLKAFGMLGLSMTYVEVEANFIADDLPVPPSKYDVELALNTFSNVKFIPILKLGLQYDFNKYFGCKAYYYWKNTSAFNNMKSSEYPYAAAEMRMNNTSAIYAGLYLTL